VLRFVPTRSADAAATFRRELGALRRPQVLLAVATGAIGGGGLFAVYSYISPILTERTGVPAGWVPVALALWGLGMVAGALAGGRLMDWRPVPAMLGAFVFMAAAFALFTVASLHAVSAFVSVFALGMTIVLATGLQVRLMDVAGDAQTLGAALNHSAFNVANALGAWLGGAALAAGYGLTAPMWVAVALTLSGMLIFVATLRLTPVSSAPGL
jgi:DHA1 family inner membrane transport protein